MESFIQTMIAVLLMYGVLVIICESAKYLE